MILIGKGRKKLRLRIIGEFNGDLELIGGVKDAIDIEWVRGFIEKGGLL